MRTSLSSSTVVLDVDGVLLSFLDGFERAFAAVLGRPARRHTMQFRLDLAYGISPEELTAVWDYIERQHIYRELPLLPGAALAVQMLRDAGCTLHYVTAILPKFTADRQANLADLGLLPAGLHAVGHQAKTDTLARLQPIMFADDQVKHLHAAPFVPTRVWIHTVDEQFPEPAGRHTHEAPSLLAFVEHWLSGRDQQLALAA